MPRAWQRVAVASFLGLAWAGAAVAQTLPVPGALTSPSAVRMDVPGGPRTPAVAVSTVPPPGGVPIAQVAVEPGIDPAFPGFPGDIAPVEVVHPTPFGMSGYVNPFASDEGGFLFTLDYLLLRPRRGAFDFALNDPGRDSITFGQLESLNYSLRSGLRVGAGYRIGDTKWDVLTEYTYFRSQAGREVFAVPGGALYPTVTRPGFIDSASYAMAEASFEYNVFDAVVGRRFCVDEHLAMRMFGGFRFANIRQNETVRFNGFDADSSFTRSQSNFDGFGPILGGEAVWLAWRGLHLYSKASGGLLTGRTNNPLVELNNFGVTTNVNIASEDRKVVPVASIGLGGGYQYRQFAVRVGYEVTNYFGLIDQPRFTQGSPAKIFTETADQSLEGFFAQLAFSF